MTRAEGFKDQGDYTPDNLLAGEYPRIERVVTIAAGADLAKGAVLGQITASGKFKLSASGSSGGRKHQMQCWPKSQCSRRRCAGGCLF